MKEGQMEVWTGNYICILILHKNEITLISLSKDPSPLALSVNVTSTRETKMTLGAGHVFPWLCMAKQIIKDTNEQVSIIFWKE